MTMAYKDSDEHRAPMVAFYDKSMRHQHAVALEWMTSRDKQQSEHLRSLFLRSAKHYCRMAMDSYEKMREWENK